MNPWLQKIGQRPRQGTDKTDNTPFVSFVGQPQGALTENRDLTEPYPNAHYYDGSVEHCTAESQRRLLFAEDLCDLPLLTEDREFIDHLLGRCAMNRRHELLSQYHDRWTTAHSQEPLAHRRENAGRFAANSWLLTQVS